MYCSHVWYYLTHSFLILHDVVPAQFLGQVRGQHVEASPELREHHVIRVTCTQQITI